mmetsp:Transcript_15260/g.44116  ORF Transcript_15260/g.44116 Transcript_15260/m.44116 type:complete len:230 (-) Transcript_15260:362-1051(-)
MSLGKINYMDVISHAGTIRSVIIISKDAELFSPSDAHLGNKWHQIVGDSLRIFSDLSRWMSTDGVEVAKNQDVPRWIRRVTISQDLLNKQLRATIWRHCLKPRRFAKGQLLGIAVYRRRGRKDKVVDIATLQYFQKRRRPTYIAVVIFQRFRNRFSHSLQPGKVHARRDIRELIENLAQPITIANVAIAIVQHVRITSCQLLNPVQALLRRVVKSVNDHDAVVAGLQQL